MWLLIAGMVACLVQTGHATTSSENFTMRSHVSSGGGGHMTSENYSSGHTLGQAVISGPVSSSTYDLYAGFWYTLEPGCWYIWDMEPDGDVDGADLYQFIGLHNDTLDIESFVSEFGSSGCQ